MNIYRSKFFWIGGFLFLLILWYFILKPDSSSRSEANIIAVTKGDLVQKVTLAGTVVPLRKSVITAPYNGYIKKIFVKVGDKVKTGDPIVSISQSLQGTDNNYPLRSAYKGVVVQIEKSEGEFIKEGDVKDFIVRIDDDSKLFINSKVAEVDMVKLKKGQETVIKVTSLSDRTYKGIIKDIALAARDSDDFRTKVAQFPTQIEILNPDNMIKPGMSVIADVTTDIHKQVLLLKLEFVHQDAKGYFAKLANGTRRDIQVGMQNEEFFEITSGLKEGEKVLPVNYNEVFAK